MAQVSTLPALDFEAKTLYWVDALEDAIESISINGENRQVITSENVSTQVLWVGLSSYIFWRISLIFEFQLVSNLRVILN